DFDRDVARVHVAVVFQMFAQLLPDPLVRADVSLGPPSAVAARQGRGSPVGAGADAEDPAVALPIGGEVAARIASPVTGFVEAPIALEPEQLAVPAVLAELARRFGLLSIPALALTLATPLVILAPAIESTLVPHGSKLLGVGMAMTLLCRSSCSSTRRPGAGRSARPVC